MSGEHDDGNGAKAAPTGAPEIDRDALVREFASESDEQLDALVQDLLVLEEHPEEAERLRSLFRTVHNLKGNAHIVGFDAVMALAHVVEDVLERLLDKAALPSGELVSLLLEAADELRRLVAASLANKPTDSTMRDALVRWVDANVAQGDRALPAQADAPAGAPRGPVVVPRRGLRVDISKLDRLLDLMGELSISRSHLGAMLERDGVSLAALKNAHRDSEQLVQELQERLMQLRLVPMGPVLRQQLRTVRDVAQASDKQVEAFVEGEAVEVDTALAESLRAPLMHLVRNAVDHGIEAPAARTAKGKPAVGRVTITAWSEAGRVVVRVQDDGQGLDRQAIVEKAREKGLLAGPGEPSDEELHRLICAPGFSTREAASTVSGRGVGLDVVRGAIEKLRGSLRIESRPGHGTTFTIRLPLTLALIDGFAVQVGEQVYVLPLEVVEECVELPKAQRQSAAVKGILELRGEALPYLRLHQRLEVAKSDERESVVVVKTPAGKAGLAVDRLRGTAQVAVKPIPAHVRQAPGVAGATVLGDGRVALILDVEALLGPELSQDAPELSPHPPVPHLEEVTP